MNSNDLYNSCLKMLNDKYNINIYPKEQFMNIYNNIYKDNDQPNNNLNKLVLLEIKKNITEPDIELRLNEIENLRNSILNNNLNNNNFKSVDIDDDKPNIEINYSKQPIQISTNYTPRYKTFIINTFKNNFKINSSIDINTFIIYPCCISVPIEIKNKTPYIILSINDGIKFNNYTYKPLSIYNATWDIWKPITKDYIDLSLNTNNWNISFYDFLYNPIELNDYIVIIDDVLENTNTFSINTNKNHYFNINDKIKIIKKNNEFVENKITSIYDNRLFIQKLDMNINDFINSKIINYKHQISITFKYHLKQS